MNSSAPRAVPLHAIALGMLALLILTPLSEVWRQSADLRHGWAAALLMAYLWWERSGERPEPASEASGGWFWWALCLVPGAALPFRLLLTPFPLWTAVLWAYVGLIVALAAAAEWRRGGRAGLRWLLPPCILLVSAMPWPAFFEQTAILPLREAMANLAAEVSNLLGRPALAWGTTVRLASGWVGIDEACGGIRSLQACVMISLFFGEWFRFTVARRGLLLLVGVAAALAGNFGRVLLLSLAAGRLGEQAVERMHDVAGWASLGGSLVVTGLVAARWGGWRFPQVAAPSVGSVDVYRPVWASAGAWLFVCASLLVAGEIGTRAWFAQGAREQAQVVRWTAVLPEAHRTFVAEPLGDIAAEMLQPDGFRAGHWNEEGGVDVSAYYIEWRKGQAARFIPFAHNPTVCLPMAGCEMAGDLGELMVEWNGLRIPFQAYRFTQRGAEMWVAFTIWDTARGRPLERPADKYIASDWLAGRWREVVERREHQPAQMLTLAISGSRDEPEAALRSRLASLLRVNQ